MVTPGFDSPELTKYSMVWLLYTLKLNTMRTFKIILLSIACILALFMQDGETTLSYIISIIVSTCVGACGYTYTRHDNTIAGLVGFGFGFIGLGVLYIINSLTLKEQ